MPPEKEGRGGGAIGAILLRASRSMRGSGPKTKHTDFKQADSRAPRCLKGKACPVLLSFFLLSRSPNAHTCPSCSIMASKSSTTPGGQRSAPPLASVRAAPSASPCPPPPPLPAAPLCSTSNRRCNRMPGACRGGRRQTGRVKAGRIVY